MQLHKKIISTSEGALLTFYDLILTGSAASFRSTTNTGQPCVQAKEL